MYFLRAKSKCPGACSVSNDCAWPEPPLPISRIPLAPDCLRPPSGGSTLATCGRPPPPPPPLPCGRRPTPSVCGCRSPCRPSMRCPGSSSRHPTSPPPPPLPLPCVSPRVSVWCGRAGGGERSPSRPPTPPPSALPTRCVGRGAAPEPPPAAAAAPRRRRPAMRRPATTCRHLAATRSAAATAGRP